MKREEFRKLVNNKVLFMDGATGSILLKRGMPAGVCNEAWIIDNPDELVKLQKEYADCGSDIILAPTFGANSETLKEHGLSDKTKEINKKLYKISKDANPNKLIAGDISMTGLMVEPLGSASFEELINVYKEQISALVDAGADILVIETIINLIDARAAIIAAKEVCNLPILVTMSFNENGMTIYGTSPESAIITLQGLGADAVGVNCSAGPDTMLSIIEKMAKYSNVPFIVKPNAGLPKTDTNNNTYYDMKPDEFAHHFDKIMKLPVGLIGGCCGTSPDFINALNQKYKDSKPSAEFYKNNDTILISSSRIGLSLEEADEIEEINVDTINAKDIISTINEYQSDFICITGNDTDKINTCLRNYHGIALYKNDTAGIDEKLSKILTKYGAKLR